MTSSSLGRSAAKPSVALPVMFLLLAAMSIPSLSQDSGSILVISQLAEKGDKSAYIDLAPHLEPALRESGKLDAIVFRPNLPGIKAMVEAKEIDEKDLKLPLTKAATHRIAKALGARYILTVSAQSTKEGIAANTETEGNIGLDQWSTLANERILPAKMKGKTLSLLESVHVIVNGLVDKVKTTLARGPQGPAPKPGVPQVTYHLSASERLAAKGRAEKTPLGSDSGNKNALPGRAASAPSPQITQTPGPASDRGTPIITQGTSPAKLATAPSTYELLIDKARRNGDTANLLIALRRAVTERPRDVRLRRDLVKAYNDRGWHDMARDEAVRAVALAPDDSALHRLLGDALLDISENEAALKEYQTAVQLAPNVAANYVALGDGFASVGKPDESLKAYEDAARADPKSPAPARRLARLYGLAGKYTECIAAIITAKGLTPAEDMASFREDHAALLTGIESMLSEILARLATTKKAFVTGLKNREQTHRDVTAQRKKAEELAGFLDQIPDVGFGRVQALYVQSATLIGQSAEKYLDYLETENTAEDEESTVLRIEAAKQLSDASKSLKAQVAVKR